MRPKRRPSQVEIVERLIGAFRPYCPKGQKNTWHDQIRAHIMHVGYWFSCVSITEYRVQHPTRKRSGTGRIDIVWVDRKGRLVFAFEIDPGFKEGSMIKLEALECPNKIIVSGGGRAHTLKLSGSGNAARKGIRHVVIDPTNDFDTAFRSFPRVFGMACEFGVLKFEPHKVPQATDNVKALREY